MFTALGRVGFEGWGVVELDSVPDPGGTPRESGAVAKRYLEELGFTI